MLVCLWNTYNPFWRCLWGQRKRMKPSRQDLYADNKLYNFLFWTETACVGLLYRTQSSQVSLEPFLSHVYPNGRYTDELLVWWITGFGVYTDVEGEGETCPNFKEISEPSRNSSCQKGDMRQATCWGPTNIRHQGTKYTRHSELLPRVLCVSVCVCVYTNTRTRSRAFRSGLCVWWTGCSGVTAEATICVELSNVAFS
jgi:hypothetical protein